MRRRANSLVRWALAGLALVALGGGTDDRSRELLRLLQEHYDGVKDLRADFVQTSHVAAVGRKDVSNGTVKVLRPGRMRWEYAKPQGRVILVNRDTLKIYSPEDKQLQIASIEAGAVSPTVLSFLMGDFVLRDLFEARSLSPDAGSESPGSSVGLKLVPREDAGFAHLELWLDPKSHQLRESVVVDLFGNRTAVRFGSVIENSGIGERDFSLTVPDGTEVIDLR